MSRTARLAFLGIAVVIAVVALVLLRPESESEKADDTKAQRPGAQEDPSSVKAEPPPTATAESAPPPPVEVTVRDFKVRGGAKRIEVAKGETVRLLVKSDVADEIHVHGYDLYGNTAPGKQASFRFKATLEGEFGIEGHQAADEGLDPLIARLVVTPS